MDFKNELKADFETYSSQKNTPVFHKIKFDSTSVYLTKSRFYDLLTSKNDHGYYRVFSWDDWRAKAFLGFEVGDISPALGEAAVIGRFLPDGDDLRQAQYQSEGGKAYFESAKEELFNIKKVKGNKIDSKDFMRMSEVVPTGAQGKAIYGEGDYIIDGAAGTGKSTTVLQKIKILNRNDGVSLNDIVVLVKSKAVVSEFERLLEMIGLRGVKIVVTSDFLRGYYGESPLSNDLVLFVGRVRDAFKKIEGEVKSLEFKVFSDVCRNDSVFDEIFRYGKFKIYYYDYVRLRNDYIDFCNKNSISVADNKKSIESDLFEFEKGLRDKVLHYLSRKNKVKYERVIEGKEDIPESDELEIKSKVGIERRRKFQKHNRLLEKINRKEKKKIEEVFKVTEKIKAGLRKRNYLERCFPEVRGIEYAAFLLSKELSGLPLLHTLIIDEAQDVSIDDIRKGWALAGNVILAGDEAQNENANGVGRWDNLGGIANSFIKDGSLNLFRLSHNFRQTYELGSFSYNFRQVLLGRPVKDISDEYFDNQKGFDRPQMVNVLKQVDLAHLIAKKITLVERVFSDSVPVVIFYADNERLNEIIDALESHKINYGLDGDEHNEVMLVRVDDIAGRSFPVVLTPFFSNMNDSSLYVVFSRAKYDLCIFFEGDRAVPANLLNLREEEYITMRGFK